jgi:hypothetical protein
MSDSIQAPMGTELSTPAATPDQSVGNPNTSSVATTPEAIELKEDSLVRIPGVDKPVKWNDHVRGFQSQATKASQRAADLERKYQEAQQSLQRYEQMQRQGQAPQQGGPDPLADLAAAPYITGQQQAEILRGLATEFQQRDQFLLGMMKAVQQLQKQLSPVLEQTSMSSFDQKIDRWLQEGGYPKEYSDLAKEIYLAYTGDDLDNEFPTIFKSRVEQIEAAIEAKRRSAAEQARRAPFVPGRGGEARPSSPLKLNVRNTAREDAENLWEAMQAGQGT